MSNTYGRGAPWSPELTHLAQSEPSRDVEAAQVPSADARQAVRDIGSTLPDGVQLSQSAGLVHHTDFGAAILSADSPPLPIRTRRRYTGNFAVGDMFWGAVPTPLRTDGGENLMTVVRREAFTITLRFTSDELLNFDMDDLRMHHRLYHDSPLFDQSIDPADITDDALTAAIEAHATANAAPTRRPYTGNFVVGDDFWWQRTASLEEHGRIVGRTGNRLAVEADDRIERYVSVEDIQRFGPVLIDPPTRLPSVAVFEAMDASESRQQALEQFLQSVGPARQYDGPADATVSMDAPPPVRARRQYTGDFARGDQFWIVPTNPNTILPQSNESALVLRRENGFVRLENPGWEALVIPIVELQRTAVLYIDPPLSEPFVQAAEGMGLNFDVVIPQLPAQPTLPTTPDNHRVVTLRR